jgi:hypothetical protein
MDWVVGSSCIAGATFSLGSVQDQEIRTHSLARESRRLPASYVRFCRRQGEPSKPDAVGVLGLVSPRRGSFSLPKPSPSHQPGEARLLQSVADGLDGGAHLPPF